MPNRRRHRGPPVTFDFRNREAGQIVHGRLNPATHLLAVVASVGAQAPLLHDSASPILRMTARPRKAPTQSRRSTADTNQSFAWLATIAETDVEREHDGRRA
jgi:hypothetical protein